jgi:hypothetical protein
MKVNAPLSPDVHSRVKKVHQHGFAAPDIAMNIDATWRWRRFAQAAQKTAVRFSLLKR